MSQREERDKKAFMDRFCEQILAAHIALHGEPFITTVWGEAEVIAEKVWDKIYADRYKEK